MTKSLFFIFVILFQIDFAFGQQLTFTKKIDTLIATSSQKPFNGIIIVSENDKTKYDKCFGFSDIDKKIPLKLDDQFVIGSISKQITAVLVLQEFDKGHLQLHLPIHIYLPELSQNWADSVTIHQLLTHTHGITEDLSLSLKFKPGTQFSYSQSGYDLLSKIIEKTSGRSFSDLSTILFEKCNMKNTFHPSLHKHKNLVKAYNDEANGMLTLIPENEIFNNAPVAAGGFISTAGDMVAWNTCLHHGKLLKQSTYKMMTSKQKGATRQHPIFGLTNYGYGITVENQNNILQLGQTGFAPGFISMNFYFPETKTSVVVLENIAYDLNDIKRTFYYHVQILDLMKGYLK
jgi:D-alanyl-D-alanine carboxypeptidase